MTFKKVSELANSFEKKLSLGQDANFVLAQKGDIAKALGLIDSSGHNTASNINYFSPGFIAEISAIISSIKEIGSKDPVQINILASSGPQIKLDVATTNKIGAAKLTAAIGKYIPGMTTMVAENLLEGKVKIKTAIEPIQWINF